MTQLSIFTCADCGKRASEQDGVFCWESPSEPTFYCHACLNDGARAVLAKQQREEDEAGYPRVYASA